MRRNRIWSFTFLSVILSAGILYGQYCPTFDQHITNPSIVLENGIGCYDNRQFADAQNWWNLAANGRDGVGDPLTQYNLGILLSEDRDEEVSENPILATEWFKRAADQGLPQAQYNYGYRLSRGIGTAPDDSVALRYIIDAANQGLPQAQYDLGYRYFVGDGVPVSQFKSYVWLTNAASSGIQKASRELYELPWTLSNSEIQIARDLADFVRNN